MADKESSFVIQLLVDGEEKLVRATPGLVCALNSTDPMIRHDAYRIIAEESNIIPSCDGNNNISYTPTENDSVCPSQTDDINTTENDNISAVHLEDDSSPVLTGSCPAPTQGPFHWSHAATLTFISEYARLTKDGQNLKPKKLWGELSTSMRANGYNLDEIQCSNKWKSLKRSYKDVVDHNSKSGNDNKTHPYQKQLQDILSDKPNISPLATASSSDVKKSVETSKRKAGELQEDEQQVGKSRKSAVSEVVSFLQDYAEKQERRYQEESKRLEAMHKEKLRLFKELIDTFKGQ